MDEKGRRRPAQGERHPFAKLTEAQAREIIAAPKGSVALAARYGIAYTVVCDIRNGVRWKHLQPNLPPRIPVTDPRGERSPNAKLTEAAVREIRASSDSDGVLGQRYGVTRSTIFAIRSRRNWKHIP
jgi:hypothetical protein